METLCNNQLNPPPKFDGQPPYTPVNPPLAGVVSLISRYVLQK